MRIKVMQPGLLVSLSVRVFGGVNYKREDVEPDHKTEEGERRATWTTTRSIPNPEEFEAATTARSKARAAISSVCCPSSFGLLCPLAEESKLRDAIESARAIAAAHNEGAQLSRVEVYALVGKIAQDDEEAARALAGEVRQIVDSMRSSVEAGDVEAIREAASKANALGAMLTPDAGEKVSAAIKEARSIAREIVRRQQKFGEAAASVVKSIKLQALESSRFSFLDLEAGKPGESVAPAGRALELDDSEGGERKEPQRDLGPQPDLDATGPTLDDVPATIAAAPQRALEL